jgi:hypothetical protein
MLSELGHRSLSGPERQSWPRDEGLHPGSCPDRQIGLEHCRRIDPLRIEKEEGRRRIPSKGIGSAIKFERLCLYVAESMVQKLNRRQA